MELKCLLLLLLKNAIATRHLQHLEIENRIVGGREMSTENYPYQLSITLNGSHHCGAALISEAAALTAAHCVKKPAQSYKVRAGTSMLNSGGIVVAIKTILLHPQYNHHNVDYDVAVVILNSSLPYGPSIRPIGLPKLNKDPPVGMRAVVSGWGLTSRGSKSSMFTHLRGVAVPIMCQRTCKECYGVYVITDRMMCAGYISGGGDACLGDSGGPLVANGQLIGIVSRGIDCGQPFYPGVYTRVARVRDFIRQHTGL